MNASLASTLLTAAFLLVFASLATSTNSLRTGHIHHFPTFNPIAFCKHTAPYKNLCMKAVHTVHGLKMTSPAMVVEANVNKAEEEASRALAKVSFLTVGQRKKFPVTTISVLHSCKENYDSAAASLRTTRRILNRHGSHDNVINELTAASTFVETCSDELSAAPEIKYLMQALHTKLEHHVRNCLDLAAVLK